MKKMFPPAKATPAPAQTTEPTPPPMMHGDTRASRASAVKGHAAAIRKESQSTVDSQMPHCGGKY